MKQEDALIKDPSTQEKTDLEKKDRAADKVGSNDVAASTDMNSKKNAEQEQTQNDKNMEQMKKHELEKEFNSSKKTVYQSPKEQKMNNFVLQVCGNVKHPEIRPTGIAHDQSLRSIQEEDEESKAWQRMVLDGRDYFPRHERSTEDDPLVNDDEFSFDSEENSFEDDDDSRGSLSEDDENDGIEEVQNANNEQQISHEYGSQAYMNRDIESSSESRESNNRKTPFIETNNNNDWFSYEGTSSSILKLPNVIAPSILPVFRSQIPKLNKEEKASFLSKNSKSNNSLDSEDATLELSLKPPTIIPDNKSLNLGFLQITKQQALPKKESYLSPDTTTGTCSNNNVNISSSTHHSTSLQSTSFISTGPIKSLKRKRRRQPTRMELFFLSVGLYLFISVTLAPLSNNDNLLMSGVRGSVRQKSDSSGKDELLWENKDESNRMQTEDVSQYQNDHMVITQANEQHQIAYPQMQQNSEQSLIHEGMTITQAHTEEIQQQSLQRQRFQPLLDQPQQQQQQQPQVQMQMQHPHLWQDANLNAADDDMIPSLNQHEKHMQMHAALVEPQKQEQLQIHAQPQSQPLAQRPQIHKNVEEQMNPQAHAQMQTPVSPQEQSHIPQPQIFHPHQNGEQHEHQQFDFNPQQLPELEIVQNNESRVHEESEQEVQQQEQVQQQQGVEPHVSNNLPVQSVQDFLEDKKIKKEEEILKKQESQEAAGPLFSAQKTSSLLDELRAIDAEHDAKEGDMPIFWLIPPDSPTTQSVKDILDNCFGLTRADVYGPSGVSILNCNFSMQTVKLIFVSYCTYFVIGP